MKPKVVPFGKYLLLERISVGGMAEVYKAKAFGVEGFEKILAIKRILPTIAEDEEFIDMFIDEAKIVGQLSHANICQVLELGRIGDSHFIAMEYIWGRDLLQIQNHYRRQKQVMPVPMAVFIMSKVCEGLDYAHRKRDPQGRPLNIVHRDVSPQNILVAYEGAVKIIDFGIARAAYRQTRTQAGVLKGKFGYMSPEQVRGLPIDRRSDLFAAGTLLYELLTGERLFLGESDFSTLDKVRNAEVEPPTKYNQNIPPELERIVLKALTRDADDRWQWASELQEALQRILINFKPVFTTQKLSGWMKQTFANQIMRDKVKMEDYARIGQDALAEARKHRPPPPPPPAAKSGPPVLGAAGQRPPPPPPRPVVGLVPPSPSAPAPDASSLLRSSDDVSLDAAEMDWLTSTSDEDDLPGESTVVADMGLEAEDSGEVVGTIPEDFPDESETDEEEATAIYFVNEEALGRAEAPDSTPLEMPVAEQPTRLLDTNAPPDEASVAAQSTVIFDENKRRAELTVGEGVSINRSVMIQSDPGEIHTPPQPSVASEVPVPLSPLAMMGSREALDVREAPTQPPAVAPGSAEHAPLLPKTMLKPPDDFSAPAAFPELRPVQSPGFRPPNDLPSPRDMQPPFGAPLGIVPSAQPAYSTPSPRAEHVATEVVRARVGDSPQKKKGRSPLLLVLLAAIGVILLGAIAGVVVLVVLPHFVASGSTGAAPQVEVAVVPPPSTTPDEVTPPETPPVGNPGANTTVPPATVEPVAEARLFLSLQPETATVEVDGSAVDRAVLAGGISLAPGGDHTVRVSSPGFLQQEVTLAPEAGQEIRREINLAQAGRLTLESTPAAAAVELDGEPAGSTPLTVENLDHGEHTLRFTLRGYDPVSKTVALTANEPAKSISVTFEKVRVAQAEDASRPPVEAAHQPPADAVTKRRVPEDAAGGGNGFLVVSTQPWGHVYVDGRDTGRDTPILPSNPLRLSAGRHQLTVQINTGQRFTFPVTIVAGETARVMRRLEAR
jgi:serine/threonine protein kinase